MGTLQNSSLVLESKCEFCSIAAGAALDGKVTLLQFLNFNLPSKYLYSTAESSKQEIIKIEGYDDHRNRKLPN